jgi:hypothetical protein
LKRIFLFGAVFLVPSLLAAQTPQAAAGKPRRATRVRGEAVGLDNRPATPATPAVRAKGTPATPATPAVPASPSHRPDHAGQGGKGRGNNPRRP